MKDHLGARTLSLKPLLKKLLRSRGYDLINLRTVYPGLSQQDLETINQVKPYTLAGVEKIHSMIHGARYVVEQEIPGAIVECGVWRGGLVMAAAKVDKVTAPLDLELKAATPWTVMAVVQQTTGLRFVWRSGVVFLVAKEEVRPLVTLVLYDLRALCAPLKSFPGPRLGLVPGGTEAEFPPEEDSGTTVSGFTAELIERLIKENVTPEAWATDTVSLTNQNGLFLVRHTPQGHREIARLLDQLGLVPLPVVRRGRR